MVGGEPQTNEAINRRAPVRAVDRRYAIQMESYSTKIGDLILRVRPTKTGWEASVSGLAQINEADTAKIQAILFASKILGRAIAPFEWNTED